MTSPMNTNNPSNTTTGTPGGSGILSNFVSENAIPLLGGILGGVFGMSGSDTPQQPVGYQGGIPDYTAKRSLLPNAFAQTTTDPNTGETVARRPGSMGRRYFTDVQYAPSSAGAVMQGTGLPAVVDQSGAAGGDGTPPSLTDLLGSVGGIANLLGALGLGGTGGSATSSTFTPGTVDDSTITTTTPGTSTFTLGDIITSDTTTVADTPINQYLQTLGFNATTPTTLTPAMIQSAQEAGFSLDDLAGALNTSTENLNAVLDPSVTTSATTTPGQSTFTLGDTTTDVVNTVISNALNDFFVGRGFVAGENRAITADDLQAALDEGFTIGDLASSFNTTEEIINQVLQPDTTTTTTTGPASTFTVGDSTTNITNMLVSNALNDFFAGRGFQAGVQQDVTATDLQAALDAGFTKDQLATGLGTEVANIDQVLNPSATTTTEAGPTSTFTVGETATTSVEKFLIDNALNNFFAERGFQAGVQQNVTVADLQAALEQGFTKQQLALGFNTDVANIDAVLNQTTTAITGTTGPTSTFTLGATDTEVVNTVINNDLNNFFVERGFEAGEQQNVTAADLQAALTAGFSKQDLATGFNTTVANIDAVLNQTTTTTTGTPSSSTFTAAGTSQTPIENAINDYLIANRGFVIGTEKTVTQDDLKELLDPTKGKFTIEQIAAGLGTTKEAVQAILDYEYAGGGQVLDAVDLATGGMAQGQGYYLGGSTDGMADLIPATIDGTQPAALSDGEFVIPADVVSHLGNGNSDAGAQQLYSMMDRVRTERTGTTKQGPEINPTKMMPA